MASLKSLRPKEAPDGEWMTINEDAEPFQVRVKPIGARFRDMHHEYRSQAARQINRGTKSTARFYNADNLPPSAENPALARAINDAVLVGVAGLIDDDGEAVTIDEFRDLLVLPEYVTVLSMVYAAALVLTNQHEDDKQDAAGNLQPASAGI